MNEDEQSIYDAGFEDGYFADNPDPLYHTNPIYWEGVIAGRKFYEEEED